ncbi:hypothetical protein DFH07DRAFT_1029884 [Mycena maculata]|uniref:Uncharacterized protein n=1 Tax=Mycena maculata TaxID=230809 RepID=A0AAD7NBJ4_9AGAR|nr:hypothetical protein DFH07DRAFT_1029884 [Mycena maculata]
MTQWLTGPKSPGLIILEHELLNQSVNTFILAYSVMKQNNWKMMSLVQLVGNNVTHQNADTSTSPVTPVPDILSTKNGIAPSASVSGTTSASGSTNTQKVAVSLQWRQLHFNEHCIGQSQHFIPLISTFRILRHIRHSIPFHFWNLRHSHLLRSDHPFCGTLPAPSSYSSICSIPPNRLVFFRGLSEDVPMLPVTFVCLQALQGFVSMPPEPLALRHFSAVDQLAIHSNASILSARFRGCTSGSAPNRLDPPALRTALWKFPTIDHVSAAKRVCIISYYYVFPFIRLLLYCLL